MTEGQRRYREYLQTPHWQATRQRILDRAQEHCERCRYFTGEVEVLPEWEIADRAEELRADDHEPCEVCGYFCQFRDADDNSGHVWLEVHHLTYDRLWCERDEDLIALCCYCHEQVTERNAIDRENEQLIAMAWALVQGR